MTIEKKKQTKDEIQDEFNEKVGLILLKTMRGDFGSDSGGAKAMKKLRDDPKYKVNKKELN